MYMDTGTVIALFVGVTLVLTMIGVGLYFLLKPSATTASGASSAATTGNQAASTSGSAGSTAGTSGSAASGSTGTSGSTATTPASQPASQPATTSPDTNIRNGDTVYFTDVNTGYYITGARSGIGAVSVSDRIASLANWAVESATENVTSTGPVQLRFLATTLPTYMSGCRGAGNLGLSTLTDLSHHFLLQPTVAKTNIQDGDRVRIRLVETCPNGLQYLASGNDAVMSTTGSVFVIRRGPVT